MTDPVNSARSKNIHLHILRASGGLKPHQAVIKRDFYNAIAMITAKLDIKDVDVIISDKIFYESAELDYISGNTIDANRVEIGINPENPKLKTGIQENVTKMLAHEFHHAKRMTGPGYGNTLFNAFITEGLAIHFENEIVPAVQALNNVLSDEELQQLIMKAKEIYHLPLTSDDHWKWFVNGSEEEGISVGAGHAIGYKIVREYLKNHRDQTAASLVLTIPEDFLIPA